MKEIVNTIKKIKKGIADLENVTMLKLKFFVLGSIFGFLFCFVIYRLLVWPLNIQTLIPQQDIFLELLKSGTWIKYSKNPILSPREKEWDCRSVRDPFVIKKDGKYFMFYFAYQGEPAAIGLAISENGFDFFRYGNKPIVNIGQPGEWDSSFVQIGSIIKIEDKYLMFYNGCRENGNVYDLCGIGVAESRDLYNWVKYSGNPIWHTEENLKFSIHYLPFVLYDQKTKKYFMYTEKNVPPGRWLIYFSISDNPYQFSDFQLAWNGAQELGIDSLGVANPKVYKLKNGSFLMGYNGSDDQNNPGNLRLAISQDGINWQSFNDGKVILSKEKGAWDGYRMENVYFLFDENDIKLYYFASESPEKKYAWQIGAAFLPINKSWFNKLFGQ